MFIYILYCYVHGIVYENFMICRGQCHCFNIKYWMRMKSYLKLKNIYTFQLHFSLLYVTQMTDKFVSLLPVILFIIIFFLQGLGRLTCSGIDASPSFPGTSTVSSSSRFVVEGVFRESGVAHSFKVVDPVLFVFESHVLYSRDLWFFLYDLFSYKFRLHCT
jgi:hypothetical protein